MKTFYLIIILLLCFCNSTFSQNVVEKLKTFYENSDFECYEKKIQKDLQKYDSIIVKLLPEQPLGPHYNVRPANIDLSKENKIFVLAITLANTEKYNFEDNIYDYIIIDSLRTFIIICVDKKMNVTGFTDTAEPGSFIDIKDDFYFPKRIRRKQIRNSIKNINKEKPEIILYCAEFMDSFMYIKGNEIYVYNMKKGKAEKFNDAVREAPDIDLIRRSNFIQWPLAKKIEGGGLPIAYRKTGHTPIYETRICPVIR
ncbi:MAG: hypothetical protein Q8908_08885 [Bacteroidota bacterium]|nr:hypothetical protein [Bacteroidota bacterium]